MKKKTLGFALKEARTALGLTQRGFAREVGAKASHIAYLESDRRRPSLPLLSRICAALELDRRAMLFLSYPEVKELVGDSQVSDREKPRIDAWQRFRTNRTLLKRHNVTRGELEVLERVSRLEPVSDPRHFIFVLYAIRQAAVPEDESGVFSK